MSTTTVNTTHATDEAAESPPASKPVIDLRDLGVWFRRHKKGRLSFKQMVLTQRWFSKPPVLWALRNVDLTCHEGETLGIVGHNGAGKSTLCLVLSGILTPDEGSVSIDGNVAALLSLGAGFRSDLSGRQNILLKAAYLGIAREEIESKMQQIIDFSELGDFIDEPIRTYSSGMRSRLSFSVASSLEPDILILDEVLSTGDKAFRKKSRNRLKEMMDRSRLIVIVSHSANFLKSTCDSCLWLDHGRAVDHGPAKRVLRAYSKSMAGNASAPAENISGDGVNKPAP